jgi:hypothetical protein
MGMRRYVQTPGPVGDFSALPLWQRAVTMDLVYVSYGLLVVALVLVSYLLGRSAGCTASASNNVGLINRSGHPLGTDFLRRDLQARLILGIRPVPPRTARITISSAAGRSRHLAGYRGSVRRSSPPTTCSTRSRGWC